MGLASALSTALTGLTAAETQIDVVGNNLANSQTVGFKESNIAFTAQFLQTLGLGSAPTTNTGGTNPRQTGLGTQVAEISPEFTQGTIQTSSSPSDVALQGQGFFIVESSTGESLYTRTGIFKTNSQNELVTVNGNRLMGYTVDDEFQLQTNQLVPLTVPVGSLQVAQATSNVFLEGTLPPTGDVADTAEVIDSAILGDGFYPRPTTPVTVNISTVPSILGISPTGAAGGTLAAGTYRYRFAFVDSAGREGTASTEVSATVGPGQGQVSFGSLPAAPTDPSYTQMRIYRLNGADYQELDTISTSVRTYTDTGARPLGATLDTTVLNATYNYLVTFRQGGGVETRPSPLSNQVNVVNGRVVLSRIPQPDNPLEYQHICIYRNLGTDSNDYRLVEEISAGQTVYTDSMSDATLTSSALDHRSLDMDGPKISGNTLLVDVVKRDELNYNSLFTEGTLSLTARKGGRQLETQTLTIDGTTTVQNLIDFIEDSVGIQSAEDDEDLPSSVNTIVGELGSLNPGGLVKDGRIRFVSNNGEGNAVSIGLSAFIMTSNSGNVTTPNVNFSSTQAAKGTSAVADFLVYDTLGIPLNVRLTAVLETRNGNETTYRWFADSSDNDPASGIDLSVGTGLVTFDGQGNFITATNSTVAIDRRNVASASPLSFDLHFESLSGLSSNTASLSASRQDGSEAGTLSSFTIGEDGILRGAFSNGVARTLGQIRLVRFANPAGMEQRGQNLFSTGANSGLPVQGAPGENGIASLVAGAVELSNTDIGGNLIQLVLATTQYRGNTRVITAAQQLLEELLNLRR